MPPDGEAMRRGLRGLDAAAQHTFGMAFTELNGSQQDELLTAAQQGRLTGEEWQGLPSARFFEELLAELTAYFYSDLQVQVTDIGYVGMADGRGWKRIGLNVREDWEPAPGTVPASPPRPDNGEPEKISLSPITGGEGASFGLPDAPLCHR